MKLGAVRLAAWIAVASIAPSAWARAPRASEHSSREATAVQRTIEASARAFTEFPRTKSIESVLSFYAKDFTGIENGQDAGLDTQRELLEELKDQLSSGANVGLSFRASNVEVRVTGSTAWATYDYLFHIGTPDGAWEEEEGKCSSVLEKAGSAWLFKHEHCSSLCPDEQLEDEAGQDPLKDRT